MKKKEQIIRDFHLNDSFDVIPRNLQPLIGVKRCGKTSILYDMVNTLSSTTDKTKLLFLTLYKHDKSLLNMASLK
jgi:predicted AAA+ superfamily ATPase